MKRILTLNVLSANVRWEAEERQELLAERREPNRSASSQLAKHAGSLQVVKSKVVMATAKVDEWRELTLESTKELKVAQSDVAPHLPP